MDIAKYIGLFLLKNNFCYLPGLGNLELRKKPAIYDGKMLHASSYEIFVTSAGAIDDNLANFIANNEQITISKATAELREYCNKAKADLQDGKELHIPYIGNIAEEYGRTIFITNPQLQFAPPPIPAQRSDALVQEERREPAPRYEEPVYQDEPAPPPPPAYPEYPEQSTRRHHRRHHEPEPEPEETGINWKKVIMAALILISVVAGAIYGIRLFRTNDYSPAAERIMPPVIDSSLLKSRTDTTSRMTAPGAAPSAIADSSETRIFKVILDYYATRAKAEKRSKQMKSYGHDVEVFEQDSNHFLILLPVRCRVADTTQVLDSLSNIFNPSGVNIFQ